MNFFLAGLNLIDQKTTKLPHSQDTSGRLSKAMAITYVIIGAVALLMFVIGGFRYILSAGDATKTAEAKRQIIYVAVGLIVAALAASIVGLVTGRLGT